jgi:hypothetical protein
VGAIKSERKGIFAKNRQKSTSMKVQGLRGRVLKLRAQPMQLGSCIGYASKKLVSAFSNQPPLLGTGIKLSTLHVRQAQGMRGRQSIARGVSPWGLLKAWRQPQRGDRQVETAAPMGEEGKFFKMSV